jgi:acyl-CoA synthetase (NDP forming)
LENEIIEIAKSYNIRILGPAENYKPILAIKSGRTYEGAKAVSSHTGSLTSSDELYEALFRQSGVIRVESVEELFNYGLAFSLIDIPKSNRVVILTNAGGPGIKEKLSKILPKFASLKNPVESI